MSGDAALPLMQAKGLSKTFGGGFGGTPTRAVLDESLTIHRGETLALVGESGSGKSTLGRLLNGLITADTGEILLDGRDVRSLRGAERRGLHQRVQMVFQDPMASLNPRHRIFTILARPLKLHGLVRTDAEARDRAATLLHEVGIGADALDRFPHEFSGGQRQRIGIARALSVEPDLLICDEPVSALDVSVQAQIVTLLQDLKLRRNLAQLFIAHDLALVQRIADRVAVMYRGRIVEVGQTRALFDSPAHPYTRALLQAVPQIGQTPREAEAVITQPGLGAACNYAPRCAQARAICGAQKPPLSEIAQGLSAACHFPFTDALAKPAQAEGAERARRIAAFAAATIANRDA